MRKGGKLTTNKYGITEFKNVVGYVFLPWGNVRATGSVAFERHIVKITNTSRLLTKMMSDLPGRTVSYTVKKCT